MVATLVQGRTRGAAAAGWWLGGYALALALLPLALGLAVTMDDGYYYLEIARNVAGGKGSTFDGLHPTNGYHPLWLLALVPAAAVAGTAGGTLLAAGLMQAACAVAAALLVYRLARRFVGWPLAALAALLWIDLSRPLWLSGLEFSLASLAVLAAADLHLRLAEEPGAGRRSYAALGLLAALAALARLDLALLAPLLAVDLWRRRRAAGRPATAAFLAFALPVTLAVGGYAGVSYALFGHPTPVSAAVKRAWSAELLAADAVAREHGVVAAKARHLLRPLDAGPGRWPTRGLALGLLATSGYLAAGLARRRRGLGDLGGPLLPWALFGLLHYLICGLVFHGRLSFAPWYFIVQPWLGALLTARFLGWAGRRLPPFARRRSAAWGLGLVLGLLAVHGARGVVASWRNERRDGPPPQILAARWLARNLPPATRLGAWNAGALGFFAPQPVVNLDGLVNSWRFFDHDRHHLPAYLRREKVAYLVDAFDGRRLLTHLPRELDFVACRDLPIAGRRTAGDWQIRLCEVLPPALSDDVEVPPLQGPAAGVGEAREGQAGSEGHQVDGEGAAPAQETVAAQVTIEGRAHRRQGAGGDGAGGASAPEEGGEEGVVDPSVTGRGPQLGDQGVDRRGLGPRRLAAGQAIGQQAGGLAVAPRQEHAVGMGGAGGVAPDEALAAAGEGEEGLSPAARLDGVGGRGEGGLAGGDVVDGDVGGGPAAGETIPAAAEESQAAEGRPAQAAGEEELRPQGTPAPGEGEEGPPVESGGARAPLLVGQTEDGGDAGLAVGPVGGGDHRRQQPSPAVGGVGHAVDRHHHLELAAGQDQPAGDAGVLAEGAVLFVHRQPHVGHRRRQGVELPALVFGARRTAEGAGEELGPRRSVRRPRRPHPNAVHERASSANRRRARRPARKARGSLRAR